MIEQVDPDQAGLRGVVASNIVEVVEELRQIDLVDLISFIRFDSFPTIEDLVSSSTELFFTPDHLSFGWVAAVDLRWDALPAVTLGLEFRHPDVSVFFNLTLRETGHEVDVLSVLFETGTTDPVEALGRAFAEARLLPGEGAPMAMLRQAQRRSRRGLPDGQPKGMAS